MRKSRNKKEGGDVDLKIKFLLIRSLALLILFAVTVSDTLAVGSITGVGKVMILFPTAGGMVVDASSKDG